MSTAVDHETCRICGVGFPKGFRRIRINDGFVYHEGCLDGGRQEGLDAADLKAKVKRLEACGADAIGALRACLVNPKLTPGQRAVAQEALDKMFAEQPRWFAGPGSDPEALT